MPFAEGTTTGRVASDARKKREEEERRRRAAAVRSQAQAQAAREKTVTPPSEPVGPTPETVFAPAPWTRKKPKPVERAHDILRRDPGELATHIGVQGASNAIGWAKAVASGYARGKAQDAAAVDRDARAGAYARDANRRGIRSANRYYSAQADAAPTKPAFGLRTAPGWRPSEDVPSSIGGALLGEGLNYGTDFVRKVAPLVGLSAGRPTSAHEIQQGLEEIVKTGVGPQAASWIPGGAKARATPGEAGMEVAFALPFLRGGAGVRGALAALKAGEPVAKAAQEAYAASTPIRTAVGKTAGGVRAGVRAIRPTALDPSVEGNALAHARGELIAAKRAKTAEGAPDPLAVEPHYEAAAQHHPAFVKATRGPDGVLNASEELNVNADEVNALADRVYVATKDTPSARPHGAKTRKQIATSILQLVAHAKTGWHAREWYKESADSFFNAAGRNVEHADRIAQAVAWLSRGTSIEGNIGHALKAYQQWLHHEPIDAGLYPTPKNNAKLKEILDGKGWNGVKTNSFYLNLLKHIDEPKWTRLVAEGGGQKPVTVDRWINRVLGWSKRGIATSGRNKGKLDWVNDQPTAAQYPHGAELIRGVADLLGVEPEEAQAAIWTSIKGHVQGRDLAAAGESFAGQLARHRYNVRLQYETASSQLPEYQTWSPAIQRSHLYAKTHLLERFLTELGQLHLPAVMGPGSYEHEVNPAGFMKLLVGVDRDAATRTREGFEGAGWKVPQELADWMDFVSAATARALKQDSVGWLRAFGNAKVEDWSAVEVPLGRIITDDEMRAVTAHLPPDTYATHTENGVIIASDGDLKGEALRAEVVNTAKAANIRPSGRLEGFAHDGANVEAAEYGAARDRLAGRSLGAHPGGQSDLAGAADLFAQRADELDVAFRADPARAAGHLRSPSGGYLYSGLSPEAVVGAARTIGEMGRRPAPAMRGIRAGLTETQIPAAGTKTGRLLEGAIDAIRRSERTQGKLSPYFGAKREAHIRGREEARTAKTKTTVYGVPARLLSKISLDDVQETALRVVGEGIPPGERAAFHRTQAAAALKAGKHDEMIYHQIHADLVDKAAKWVEPIPGDPDGKLRLTADAPKRLKRADQLLDEITDDREGILERLGSLQDAQIQLRIQTPGRVARGAEFKSYRLSDEIAAGNEPNVGDVVRAHDAPAEHGHNLGRIVELEGDPNTATVHFVNRETGQEATREIPHHQLSFPGGIHGRQQTAKWVGGEDFRAGRRYGPMERGDPRGTAPVGIIEQTLAHARGLFPARRTPGTGGGLFGASAKTAIGPGFSDPRARKVYKGILFQTGEFKADVTKATTRALHWAVKESSAREFRKIFLDAADDYPHAPTDRAIKIDPTKDAPKELGLALERLDRAARGETVGVHELEQLVDGVLSDKTSNAKFTNWINDSLPDSIEMVPGDPGSARPTEEIAKHLYEELQAERMPPKLDNYKWVPRDFVESSGVLTSPPRLRSTIERSGAAVIGGAWNLANDLAVRAGMLYLNPGYYAANLLGNAALMLVHQGFLAPRNLGRAVKAWWTMDETSRATMDELMQHGAFGGALDFHNGIIRGGTRWLANAANIFVDLHPRRAAFLHEADKLGHKTGQDVQNLIHRARKGDEKAMADLDVIQRKANDAMIDFDRASGAERDTMSTLVAFYPWFRGSARYVKRLPAEHPLLTAGLAGGYLAQQQYAGQELGDRPGYASDLIPIGGGKVFNPHQVLGPLSTVEDALKEIVDTIKGNSEGGIIQMANPVLAAVMKGLIGYDPFTHQQIRSGLPGIAEQLKEQLAPTRVWETLTMSDKEREARNKKSMTPRTKGQDIANILGIKVSGYNRTIGEKRSRARGGGSAAETVDEHVQKVVDRGVRLTGGASDRLREANHNYYRVQRLTDTLKDLEDTGSPKPVQEMSSARRALAVRLAVWVEQHPEDADFATQWLDASRGNYEKTREYVGSLDEKLDLAYKTSSDRYFDSLEQQALPHAQVG